MNYAIYPYSNQALALLQYLAKKPFSFSKSMDESNIEENTISHLVFPRGWSKIVNSIAGYEMSTELNEVLKSVDGVIFADISEWEYLYSDVKRKIQLSLNQGKHVICCTKLTPDEIQVFSKYQKFLYLDISLENESDFALKPYQIQEVPVICIGNMFRGMDTSSIVANIDKFFRDKGFTTLVIGTNRNGLLIGHNLLPDNFFQMQPYENTVRKLNTLINYLQNKKRADLIIIQLDDGMIRYSGICGEGYGIKNYIISQAISVDYFIFHAPFTGIDPDGMKDISRLFHYRYGYPIDAIVFSQIAVDDSASLEDNRVVFLPIKIDLMKEAVEAWKKQCSEIICADISSYEDLHRIAIAIYEKLSRGVDAV